MKENDGVWAPTAAKLEGYSGSDGHFETYFLRDLYEKGEINDELIVEIIEQNEISASPDNVIGAITDASGESIPKELAEHISDVASVVTVLN